MSYEDLPFPKPNIFEGRSLNSKILIIGSGHSTKQILNQKELLRESFDIIIACNYSFQFFDDIIDYHIVTEKTSKSSNNNVYKSLSAGNFRKDVVRIVNWKGLDLYPSHYTLIKTTRSNFDYNCNVRKYKNNNKEGLLIGPPGKQKFSLGSVMLSAMHFSAILGAAEIYMIGADMCFKDEYDHFYNDQAYRNSVAKIGNAHNIVQVELNGRNYDTTEFFKESAEYIDKAIELYFLGINIYDFSDGLLRKPIKITIDNFLKKV